MLQGFVEMDAALFAEHKCQVVVRCGIFVVGLDGSPQIFFRGGIVPCEELFRSRGEQVGIIGFG